MKNFIAVPFIILLLSLTASTGFAARFRLYEGRDIRNGTMGEHSYLGNNVPAGHVFDGSITPAYQHLAEWVSPLGKGHLQQVELGSNGRQYLWLDDSVRRGQVGVKSETRYVRQEHGPNTTVKTASASYRRTADRAPYYVKADADIIDGSIVITGAVDDFTFRMPKIRDSEKYTDFQFYGVGPSLNGETTPGDLIFHMRSADEVHEIRLSMNTQGQPQTGFRAYPKERSFRVDSPATMPLELRNFVENTGVNDLHGIVEQGVGEIGSPRGFGREPDTGSTE